MKNKKVYRSEFHVHTIFSSDSFLSYPLLLLMLKIKKINCVAITDHNEIKGAIRYKKKLEKHNINVIVGEEIFSKEGEIIGLFLSEKIDPFLSAEETIDKIIKQNGIVYIPHPYDKKRYKTVLNEKIIKNNYEKIDFIEIHNGRNIKKIYSEKQKEIQEKYNLMPIIGSDAHTFFEIGRNIIITNEKISRSNIKNIINKNNFTQKKCLLFAHKLTIFDRMIKLIIGGKYNEVYRIILKRCRKRK